jgi:ABC-type uncharacterized transport system substrate-binding protein
MNHASSTMPVVFLQAIDPVGAGFGGSMVRPGNNLTSVSYGGATPCTKSVELCKALLPSWRARQ